MFTNGKDRAEETLLRLLSDPPAIRHISQDRCQRAAVRCRRRAEAAKDEIGKATWITFAKEWLKLADEAEQSTGVTGVAARRLEARHFRSWEKLTLHPPRGGATCPADGPRSLAATGPSFDRMLGVQSC
jgi:hypothetical protein